MLPFWWIQPVERRACGLGGCNDLYALGRRTSGENDQIVPKPVAGLTDVVQVSVGDNHMLVLKSNGRVYYWGMLP